MLQRTDTITNKVLEPITFVLAYPTVFFVDINNLPHYTVTLHALPDLSFSFTIPFTVNNHKIIVEIHYNFNNNTFLTSSLTINNIYIHAVRSVCLSTYLSFIAKPHCKSLRSIYLTNFTKNCKYLLTSVSVIVGQLPPVFFCFFHFSPLVT